MIQSIAFGGPKLDTLFVTTSSVYYSISTGLKVPGNHTLPPSSGALFMVKGLGVKSNAGRKLKRSFASCAHKSIWQKIRGHWNKVKKEIWWKKPIWEENTQQNDDHEKNLFYLHRFIQSEVECPVSNVLHTPIHVAHYIFGVLLKSTPFLIRHRNENYSSSQIFANKKLIFKFCENYASYA